MSQYKDDIESIGLRPAGPHTVLDTVREGPPPHWPSRKNEPEHVVVVCQDCGAEWFEGGLYPAKCEQMEEDYIPDDTKPNRLLSGTVAAMDRE